MTTSNDPPRDFVGIEGIVESIRVARRSEESARFHIALSVRVQDNGDLLAELAGNLKNVVFVGFGFMQAALPFIDQPANGTAPIVVSHVIDKNGDTVLPHKFIAARGNKQECKICELAEGHGIHDAAAREARRGTPPQEWARHYFMVNDDTPGLCGTCHRTEGDELHLRTTADSVEAADELSDSAKALIESIDDPDPNADVTDEQAAARERIAAKSGA